MPKDKGDPPSHPVYNWEDQWVLWNHKIQTFPACRQMIRMACRRYKVPPPIVHSHPNKCGYSWYRPKTNTISLQLNGQNPSVCLHEAAHAIGWHYFKNRIDDHGPTFLGIYLWLLDAFKIAPFSALHASAREHGLRWRDGSPEIITHGRHRP